MEGDMTKRIIDIDDDYLAAASAALGSPTMKHAVNEALRLVAQMKTGLDHIDILASGELTDLADDEVMASAWR
jgi:Arc/MetJ family transcription regulator